MKYRFNAKDFYRKKDEQEERCALTGVELQPHTCDIAHIAPLHKGGEHCYENIELVHRDVVKWARELTDDEILEYAVMIVEHLGAKKGYQVLKSGRK